jgi:hypothetical protein
MESDLKLFAAYLGGRADGCTIELHDVVFVVSRSIEEAYPQFVKKWFGNTHRLHLDSHLELKYIDGFEVNLVPLAEAPLSNDDDEKLYFINLGAYDVTMLTEVHQSGFFVAKQKMHAVSAAKKRFDLDLFQVHVDDSVDVNELLTNEDGEGDVDDLVELTEVDGYRIVLTPTDKTQSFETICGYRKIDVGKFS